VIGETTALGLSALMAIAHLFAGVSLPANHGIRPIESIIAGDLVWAMDPDTGEEDWRQVLETFVHPDAVLELAIEDGSSTEVLTVTGGHPFWERERGWTPAGELLPGDEVFTSRGGWARIGGGTWIAGEQLVYSFEVEGAHTYFVGETGAWVHNACWTPGKAGDPAANAFRHWRDHGHEFPHLRNSLEYVAEAHTLRDAAAANPLTHFTGTRPNGDVLIYHPPSNTFGVFRNGVPSTVFRPTDGASYFWRQVP